MGPDYNRAPNIWGTQKGTTVLATTQRVSYVLCILYYILGIMEDSLYGMFWVSYFVVYIVHHRIIRSTVFTFTFTIKAPTRAVSSKTAQDSE